MKITQDEIFFTEELPATKRGRGGRKSEVDQPPSSVLDEEESTQIHIEEPKKKRPRGRPRKIDNAPNVIQEQLEVAKPQIKPIESKEDLGNENDSQLQSQNESQEVPENRDVKPKDQFMLETQEESQVEQTQLEQELEHHPEQSQSKECQIEKAQVERPSNEHLQTEESQVEQPKTDQPRSQIAETLIEISQIKQSPGQSLMQQPQVEQAHIPPTLLEKCQIKQSPSQILQGQPQAEKPQVDQAQPQIEKILIDASQIKQSPSQCHQPHQEQPPIERPHNEAIPNESRFDQSIHAVIQMDLSQLEKCCNEFQAKHSELSMINKTFKDLNLPNKKVDEFQLKQLQQPQVNKYQLEESQPEQPQLEKSPTEQPRNEAQDSSLDQSINTVAQMDLFAIERCCDELQNIDELKNQDLSMIDKVFKESIDTPAKRVRRSSKKQKAEIAGNVEVEAQKQPTEVRKLDQNHSEIKRLDKNQSEVKKSDQNHRQVNEPEDEFHLDEDITNQVESLTNLVAIPTNQSEDFDEDQPIALKAKKKRGRPPKSAQVAPPPTPITEKPEQEHVELSTSRSGRGIKRKRYLYEEAFENDPEESESDAPVEKKKRKPRVKKDQTDSENNSILKNLLTQNVPQDVTQDVPQNVTPKSTYKKKDGIACGKCDETSRNLYAFKLHIARQHGGVALKKGEDQEISEEMAIDFIKEAFNIVKTLKCYRCDKAYSSFVGMKLHLRICSKTEEELEALMVKCDECDFKTMSTNMRSHYINIHFNKKAEPEKEVAAEKEAAAVEFTPSGRRKRTAASKATQKMVKVLEEDKEADPLARAEEELFGDDMEDSDDDYHMGMDLDDRECAPKGSYQCEKCHYEAFDRKLIHEHFLKEHANDDEILEEEDEGDTEHEISSDEDLDDDLKEGKKKSSGGATSSHRVSKGKDGKYIKDTTICDIEIEFRKKNFGHNQFSQFEVQPLKFLSMDILPKAAKASFKFTIRKKNDLSLDRFQSANQSNEKSVIYAGGSIIASDWCPIEDTVKRSEIIALSADLYEENQHNQMAFIQFWAFDHNAKKSPYLSSLIVIKETFKIHCLKWCPSLQKMNKKDSRIGLLAVACSDGTIKIYTIGQDMIKHEQATEVIETEPSKILKRKDASNSTACLKICWFRGKHHRIVAGVFNDGYIGLWDLNNQSPLLFLTNHNVDIYPKHLIRGHHPSNHISIALSDSDGKSFPEYMYTGSSDKKITVWNLSHPKGPIVESDQLTFSVNDLVYMSHYEQAITAAFDDSGSFAMNRVVFYDQNVSEDSKGCGIMLHNSSVVGLDFSPWMNLIVSGSSSGSVVIYFGEDGRDGIKIRNHNHRRSLVYESSMCESAVEGLEYMKTETEMRQNFPELCIDFDDKSGNWRMVSETEIHKLKEKGVLNWENVRRYPALSVNRLNFNPNLKAKNWLFSGSQAGIGRFISCQL